MCDSIFGSLRCCGAFDYWNARFPGVARVLVRGTTRAPAVGVGTNTVLLKSWKETRSRPLRTLERGAALILGCALVLLLGQRAASAAPVIDTYVGGGNGDGNLAINAVLDPRGFIAVGSPSSPDFYIADGRNDLVRHVDGATGLIETIAGNGVHGYGGDGID